MKLATLAALAVLFAFPVFAQEACGVRADVVTMLKDEYGETRRSMALAVNGAVVETFASDDTGTWTITATGPNGITCLVASGTSYHATSDPTGEAL